MVLTTKDDYIREISKISGVKSVQLEEVTGKAISKVILTVHCKWWAYLLWPWSKRYVMNNVYKTIYACKPCNFF